MFVEDNLHYCFYCLANDEGLDLVRLVLQAGLEMCFWSVKGIGSHESYLIKCWKGCYACHTVGEASGMDQTLHFHPPEKLEQLEEMVRQSNEKRMKILMVGCDARFRCRRILLKARSSAVGD